MKRILIGLASIALLSLSSNAFAQASGESSGKSSAVGGPAAVDPTKMETDTTTPAAAGATDMSAASNKPDASQSKRKDGGEPAQSGSK